MQDKYITFKRNEFLEFLGEHALPPGSGAPADTDCAPIADRLLKGIDGIELHDAVVIRRQDLFAGPALHGYANSIAIAAKLLYEVDRDTSLRLRRIADYFSEQAVLADDDAEKLPD
jgi:hypothetical protein